VTHLVGLTLLIVGSCAVALAAAVPEIDPGSSAAALALLAGGLLVIRGRRRKQ
jgi:MYXO-CTERM domain-containing protein